MTAATTTPSVSTNKTSYAQGETIVATYSGGGSASDWVGISPASSAASSFINWIYSPNTGTSVNLSSTNLPVGSYKAHFFCCNSTTNVLASSATFTVTSGTSASIVNADSLSHKAKSLHDIDYTHSRTDNLSFNIKPNPVSSILTVSVQSNSESPTDISITDLLGRKVKQYEKIMNKGQTDFYFDVSDLKNGIYLVIVSQNGHLKTQKFVVQR